MKLCPKCEIEKDELEFNKNKNRKDGLQRVCKICSRAEDMKCYFKSKELNPGERNKRNNKFRLSVVEKVNKYKSENGCKKCGNNKHYCLDFHHLDPSQKDFNIGNRNTLTFSTLMKEIEKCVLLCSNCHREFHFLERTNKVTINEYLAP